LFDESKLKLKVELNKPFSRFIFLGIKKPLDNTPGAKIN